MARNTKRTYAVIDIETTGGLPKRDKITEIAIVIFDGKNIIDQFETLINPERSIPTEITRITGITNDMVEDAPKFYEVAKQVVQMTEGTILVAHNVRFDYSFIQEEFARLGFAYTRKQLCTVRMARKAFPGLRSYSLGSLIQHFGIEVHARHRALEDTLATTTLFGKILQASIDNDDLDSMINRGIKEQKLPEEITLEKLHNLPETTGVYYFHNELGHVVYVGKSINIKTRVMQHFSKITRKSEAMMMQVKDISYEVTGSELVSLLLESEEIKSLQPIINKAQRVKEYPYFMYYYQDKDDYITLAIDKVSQKALHGKKVLNYFSSLQGAKSYLGFLREEFILCEEYFKIRNKKSTQCMYYDLGKCYGACKDMEEAMIYNDRAQLAINHATKSFEEDLIVITKGRNPEERAIILVEDGFYRGFGYMLVDELSLGIEEIKECIDYKKPNVECNGILATYLQSHHDYELVKL